MRRAPGGRRSAVARAPARRVASQVRPCGTAGRVPAAASQRPHLTGRPEQCRKRLLAWGRPSGGSYHPRTEEWLRLFTGRRLVAGLPMPATPPPATSPSRTPDRTAVAILVLQQGLDRALLPILAVADEDERLRAAGRREDALARHDRRRRRAGKLQIRAHRKIRDDARVRFFDLEPDRSRCAHRPAATRCLARRRLPPPRWRAAPGRDTRRNGPWPSCRAGLSARLPGSRRRSPSWTGYPRCA